MTIFNVSLVISPKLSLFQIGATIHKLVVTITAQVNLKETFRGLVMATQIVILQNVLRLNACLPHWQFCF